MFKGSESVLQQLPTMSKEQMLCVVRSHKKLKTNMAGYSSLKLIDLRNTLEKALRGETPNPRKKSENKWQNALKTYNEGKSGFIIPKKNSVEYNEILDIMNGTKKELEVMPKRGRGRPRKQVQNDQSQQTITSLFRKA